MNNEANWSDHITPPSNNKPDADAGDVDSDKVTFSDAQQTRLNELLAAERRAGDARAEAMRKQGALEIARLRGTTDAATYLETKAAEQTANELEREQLKTWFSARPGAGQAASELQKTDKILYEKLRKRAVFHGLVSRRPWDPKD